MYKCIKILMISVSLKSDHRTNILLSNTINDFSGAQW